MNELDTQTSSSCTARRVTAPAGLPQSQGRRVDRNGVERQGTDAPCTAVPGDIDDDDLLAVFCGRLQAAEIALQEADEIMKAHADRLPERIASIAINGVETYLKELRHDAIVCRKKYPLIKLGRLLDVEA